VTSSATSDRFFLPPGYVERPRPSYFVDVNDRTWQPHVYPLAAALARHAGATHIVDVGCGRAGKLAALRGELSVIGIDYGPNLQHCREQYPDATWIEADLEQPAPCPLDERLIAQSVIVCADVIEHLVDPTALLAMLAGMGADAPAVLLSTPERVRTWGPTHLGPPPNVAHVREWSLDELCTLATHHGLTLAFAGVTASDDQTWVMSTSLLVASRQDATPAQRTALGEFCRDTLQALDTAAREARRAARASRPEGVPLTRA
jgi:SAM-dependent methyltransferase